MRPDAADWLILFMLWVCSVITLTVALVMWGVNILG